MRDVLTTSYLAIPEAFRLETLELTIEPTGPSAGHAHRQPGCGQWVLVAQAVNQAAFYAYLFRQ